MWPFTKKKPGSQSFQEFRRTYVPPEPPEIPNPVMTVSVCPLCCEIIPAGTVSAEYPCCPDCSSEAIDIDVIPLAEFLEGKTVEDLRELLRRSEAAEGFLPAYKEIKSERIRQLISLKLG